MFEEHCSPDLLNLNKVIVKINVNEKNTKKINNNFLQNNLIKYLS